MTKRDVFRCDRQPDGASDRRWVVVGEDGWYVTLGQVVDPTEDELRAVERQLAAQGSVGGWRSCPPRHTGPSCRR